jgi:Cu2+-exporting ATPase
MLADFKRRFIVSLVLTIPVLLLSPTIQSFFVFELHFPGVDFIPFLLPSVVYFYGGYPFLKGIKEEFAEKTPGMMTQIAIAINVAYIYSSAVVFGLQGGVFFWELVTLIDVMLLGHWLEMRSVVGASKALEELVNIMQSVAHLVDDNLDTLISTSEAYDYALSIDNPVMSESSSNLSKNVFLSPASPC